MIRAVLSGRGDEVIDLSKTNPYALIKRVFWLCLWRPNPCRGGWSRPVPGSLAAPLHSAIEDGFAFRGNQRWLSACHRSKDPTTSSDPRVLIEDAVVESRNIEYKTEIGLSEPGDKVKFLATVSSFDTDGPESASVCGRS